MLLLENKKKLGGLFDIKKCQQEFHAILSFATELCEIPHAFISFNDTENHIIQVNVGFDFITIPESVLLYQLDVIQQNKISIVTDITQDSNHRLNNLTPFSFFAGLPICIDENLVVGTLCIMDIKPKVLSRIELKSLNHAVSQIQFLLELDLKNKELQKIIQEKENHFELFIENSNEIFFELALDGTINSVSENWTASVGYEINEVVGKKNSNFIHPEDIVKVSCFLSNLTLGGKSDEEIIYRMLHKEGYYAWHSSRVKLVKKENRQFYIGNCRDITANVKALQDLSNQKEFYEKILDRLPIDISVWDYNHKYTYLNPVAIKNRELREFIIGKDDFEHSDRGNTFVENLRVKFMQALEARDSVRWEDTIQLQNGQNTYHTREFVPVFLENGSLEMMLGFGIDVTESKKNQLEILKSRQLTDSIIKNVAVGILVQSPQSEILENNKAVCEMFGLTENQLLGKKCFGEQCNVIHLDGTNFRSEDYPVIQAIQKLKPINKIVMGVHRPIFNDLIWLLVDAVPVFGDFGELLYVICSFNDITTQKKAEDDLIFSNERFTYSNEATFDVLWDWNMIADEIFIGESYSVLFGHRFESNIITEQKYASYVHPEDREAYFESIKKSIGDGVYRWSHEYQYLKADGTYAYVNNKGVIIRNDAGRAIRVIGAMQDITKEKKLKDELQQSEEQFKSAFQHSAVGTALVNLEGYYIEINERLCEIFGYSNEELKSIKFQDINHPKDLKQTMIDKKKIDYGEISNFSGEKRFIHKNKSIVWTHISVSVLINEANHIDHYIVQIIDITERKKIEKENRLLTKENNRNKTIQLNEAKNMYRLLADNTVDLVCLHNLDTSFQYVSPSIQKLLGYTPEELIGKFPYEFVHPEDIETLKNSIHGLTEIEDVSVRARFRNIENNYFWFESKAILVKENGVPINFQSSTRDITQRKEAEEIVENTLIQERELNELRTNLISTISHEFRTPMTTIRTSTELIAMYLEGCNFENSIHVAKRVNTITEEIDRIVELMDAVLTISKDDSGKTSFNPVEFDLKQVCINVIENSYSEQIDKRKVETSFDGENFVVFADINLMKYSLFNLLNNAFKYSKGTVDVILKLFIKESKVVVEIIDFGIGIPEEDQTKLFNTFFRASNTNGIQGTGLGLYIIKTFTEKNFGTVQLESELGKGTKVTLQFPLLT
ncbi:PAS domain S-box protein [Flavobacterium sp. GB2R13]|uniref:PAS domain S-box protein n=1 Tax=Flavobacterium algoris TaxID=3398733 RepID=UPI003A87B535